MEIDRIYRLKTGTQPVRLLDYDPEDGAVMIEYCRSGQRYMRDASDLVPYEDHEKGDVPMAKQLFQIKGTDKYAHRIATDSQGRAVVEVKGNE